MRLSLARCHLSPIFIHQKHLSRIGLPMHPGTACWTFFFLFLTADRPLLLCECSKSRKRSMLIHPAQNIEWSRVRSERDWGKLELGPVEDKLLRLKVSCSECVPPNPRCRPIVKQLASCWLPVYPRCLLLGIWRATTAGSNICNRRLNGKTEIGAK